MGWLISALIALLAASLLAIVSPTLFGPAVAGLAPLLLVVALVGLGAVWWRHSRSRVDADAPGERPAAADEVRGEDDRVET